MSGEDLSGHWVQSGLRHPEVLKWLHVALFFVLLKHAEMRTVPGVEAAGKEEGRADG